MLKHKAILLTTTLITSLLCFCVDLSAQEFGRGRFLKRLREEINEAKKNVSKQKQKQAARQKQARKQNARTPTPANPRSRQPQRPFEQLNPYQRPTSQSASGRYPSRAPQSRTPNSPIPNQRAVPSNYRRPAPPRNSSSNSVSRRGSRSGFGMEVSKRRDRIVVSKIDPRGNAAEAGLRSGDIILEIGGLEVENVEDFDEFTKILGEGDQMEFKFSSRGKERTAIVSFGEVAEVPQEPIPSFVPSNGNDFAPPSRTGSSRSSSRSIMDRGTGSYATTQNSNIQSLQRIIEQQRLEIDTLRAELVRLRQQIPLNRRNAGTSLNGPGN